MSRTTGIHGLAASLKHLPFLSSRGSEKPAAAPDGEARLYMQRALRAAAEERHDVAMVFCRKALDLSPGDLAARLLLAWLYDRAFGDVDEAVAAYRKVITLAGYDGANPYCVAAREALDALMTRD